MRDNVVRKTVVIEYINLQGRNYNCKNANWGGSHRHDTIYSPYFRLIASRQDPNCNHNKITEETLKSSHTKMFLNVPNDRVSALYITLLIPGLVQPDVYPWI